MTIYARVTTVQIQQGKIDEFNGILDSITPMAMQQKGYKGGFRLIDRNTGKGFVISLWETEVDLKTSEAGWYPSALDKIRDCFSAPSVQENYEVSSLLLRF